MSHQEYATAVVELIRDGSRLDDVLSGLDAMLARRGHAKLKRAVLREVYRLLKEQLVEHDATLTVSRAEDAKRYKDAIEAVCESLGVALSREPLVDDTIVGGFILATEDALVDRSYKRTLQNLYRTITNAPRT